MSGAAADPLERYREIYRDLHAHPELSFAEHRTAGIVAETLESLGYEVTTGVGGTGVVGVLERGTGPIVMLRADMDALPVQEQTGLPYASTVVAELPDGGTSPIMHACGHDMHTTALLAGADALAADPDWQGRLVLVFQPAEEKGAGARAMLDDGLLERFGIPVVVLGQHVAPMPAGAIGLRSGASFANSDSLRITVHGKGGHGSRPETTVDPVVLGSAIVLRLQTVVSREIAATDEAVVTVGSFQSGETGNIIPAKAVLQLSIRTFDPDVRSTVLAAIERIVKGEAVAAGADAEPKIEVLYSFPAVVNDAAAVATVAAALQEAMPQVRVVEPGPVTGSEDVGLLAIAAGAPCAYWLLGGADPSHFTAATTVEELAKIVAGLPSNHSPFYAPAIDPTLQIGADALHAAARAWLA